jgi:hypothetical protein
MLDVSAALTKLKDFAPNAKPKRYAIGGGLFIFEVDRQLDPNEDGLDPFYAVGQKTGIASEFSVLTDISPREFDALIFRSIP